MGYLGFYLSLPLFWFGFDPFLQKNFFFKKEQSQTKIKKTDFSFQNPLIQDYQALET